MDLQDIRSCKIFELDLRLDNHRNEEQDFPSSKTSRIPSMKLQNAHPLNPSSFRIILQFHSVKIRKNTREEYIDSDAIYIYIHSSLVGRYFPLERSWKKKKKKIRSRRKEKGGTVSPRWKISSIVINPRADALRSKGENRSEYRKGGVVGCVTGPKLEGRRFIVQSINEFPVGSKNGPPL